MRLSHRRRRTLGQADLGHARAAEAHLDQGPRWQVHDDVRDVELWSLRKVRSASIPIITRPMTAGCRRSSMSIPTRRSIPTSTARSSPTSCGGIYYKPDFNFGGVQGGAMPYKVERRSRQVAVDPYGPESPDFIVGDDFCTCGARRWRIARSASRARSPQIQGRTVRRHRLLHAGQFPGFRRVPRECLRDRRLQPRLQDDRRRQTRRAGDPAARRAQLLEPFRFGRYAKGKLHPVSNSPFPWS